MASITWPGGTIQSKWAGTPAARFRSWEPRSQLVGPSAVLLGSGLRRKWAHRTDHAASFAIEQIPHTDMALMVDLVTHLDGGGEVTVVCDDRLGSVYTCVLAPGADLPHPELADAPSLTYRMTFTLLNVDGTPMVCVYN